MSLYEHGLSGRASKFQRLIYITLPSIKSVIVTMLILSLSKMMSIGLDAPLLLGNNKVMGSVGGNQYLYVPNRY